MTGAGMGVRCEILACLCVLQFSGGGIHSERTPILCVKTWAALGLSAIKVAICVPGQVWACGVKCLHACVCCNFLVVAFTASELPFCVFDLGSVELERHQGDDLCSGAGMGLRCKLFWQSYAVS